MKEKRMEDDILVPMENNLKIIAASNKLLLMSWVLLFTGWIGVYIVTKTTFPKTYNLGAYALLLTISFASLFCQLKASYLRYAN